MTGPIRILVVDDHRLFREGLIRLLAAEPGVQVLGNCATVVEALEVLRSEPIEIVLLDFDLGSEVGARLLAELQQQNLPARVLMVTAGMSNADMVDVLDQGAAGIFLKHSAPDLLVEAIRRAAAGEMWLDPRTVRAVLETRERADQGAVSSSLTVREKKVLRRVLEGESNKLISANLSLSESSVKAVLQQLFAKTGVRTRSQLVRLALERHSQDWLAEDNGA